MDNSDLATKEEERQRELAIAAARNKPERDLEAEICTGCNYVSKSCYGKTCEASAECLHDLTRRERAGQ